MNHKDIGWLAGVLDGEGCIHASQPWKKENDRKSGGRHHFDIRVILTNNSTLLLEKAGRILREHQIIYKFRDGCSNGTSEIVISQKPEIAKFLNLVVEDLSCKKRSAEVVLDYISKYGGTRNDYGVKGATEENVREYIRLFNILKKQKGKSPLTVETTRYASNLDEDIVRHS